MCFDASNKGTTLPDIPSALIDINAALLVDIVGLFKQYGYEEVIRAVAVLNSDSNYDSLLGVIDWLLGQSRGATNASIPRNIK